MSRLMEMYTRAVNRSGLLRRPRPIPRRKTGILRVPPPRRTRLQPA